LRRGDPGVQPGQETPLPPLKIRLTPGCGADHDRDINAARNILAAGLAER
jgi:hypothetical protein